MFFRFNIVKRLLRWWIHNHSYAIVKNSKHINGYLPFKTLHSTTTSGQDIEFSVMHSRRRPKGINFHNKYLVKVSVHKDLPSDLQEFNDVQLMTVDIFGGFIFPDKLVAEILLELYVDNMLKTLKEKRNNGNE